MKKMILGIVLLALFASIGIVAATDGVPVTSITTAMSSLVNTIKSLFGGIVIVLIILAGLAYGAGNILGNEVGAKSKKWAIDLILGAVLGLVIYIIAPVIIKKLI